MSSGSTGLAGRYAGALYALAIDSNKVDSIHDELGRLSGLIVESQDLGRLLESPILSREEQQRAITTIMEKAGADTLTVKFLGTLAANGRLSALPRIIEAFHQEHARRRGQASAEVISQLPMTTTARSLWKKRSPGLLVATKCHFRACRSVNDWWTIVRIGSRMIDTSIKTKLSRLESAMKGIT